MLEKLPVELKLKLLLLDNDEGAGNLKYINQDYYKLSNEVLKIKVSKIISLSQLNCRLIFQYLDGISFWNGPLTDILKPELNYHTIYNLLHHRKIYFDEKDTQIQSFNDPSNDYRFINGKLILKKVQSIQHRKLLFFAKGKYTWDLHIRNHKYSKGLGTLTFRLDSLNTKNLSYSLPNYIGDFLPDDSFVSLRVCQFEVVNDYEIFEISMEEIGLFTKTNLEFLNYQFHKLNDDRIKYDESIMYYTDPEYEENLLEKLVYMNLQGIYDPIDTSIYFPYFDLEDYYTSGSRMIRHCTVGQQEAYVQLTHENLIPWKAPFI